MLRADTAPAPSWVVVLAGGFALAVLAWGYWGRVVSLGRELQRRPALIGAAITLLGLAGWALAITSA
jgi:hypothetical protein